MLVGTAMMLMGIGRAAGAQTVAGFDFTKAAELAAWRPTHDIGRITATPEGMRVEITGADPYTVGGARDLPAGQPLWLVMRLKSDTGGMGQVFYFAADRGPTEESSVRFPVRAGAWDDVRVPLPPLGPGTRFRIDPPGTRGACVIAYLRFEPRTLLPEPNWPAPPLPKLASKGEPALTFTSGPLELIHGREPGGFELRVGGQRMAVGWTQPRIGYLMDGRERWVDVARAGTVTMRRDGAGLLVTTTARDPDGAQWNVTRSFAPAAKPGIMLVRTTVTVSRDRDVVFLPMLTLLPGSGSFGERKNQALFCGLEYLDSDPTEVSSSEKDIIGPGARRRTPDSERITVPLMAVQADGRYVALAWQPDAQFTALFDSPDRTLHGGGHLMGLLFPGSNGSNREEGSLLPYAGERLEAGSTLVLSATIFGGKGDSVVPAVRAYVDAAGLPPVPNASLPFDRYAALAAAGWLDSKIRDDGRYRHAWPGGFQPQPAADAAVWMDWLARQAPDAALAGRLAEGSKAAIAQVDPGDYDAAGVGHVRYPVAPLLHGAVAENARRAGDQARELLARFAPDGTLPYRRAPGALDYGRTHFAPDADGLTAQVVSAALEAASVSGDPALIGEAVKRLHGLDKFANTAPRGAQTWEVPLHTPDILASAHLVRAFTLGYELTGDRKLLDMATYWAWTGVPFVYLYNPTGQPVGPYATVPVYGATQWKAPDWMGLPVQWCGLVYADALYRLLRDDPHGPWKALADGITASGVQQTWPLGLDAERVGLLPDSFALRPQMRNDAAINPATLLACAQRLYGRPLVYDFRAYRQFDSQPLLAHAPGELTDERERPGRVAFRVKAWNGGSYYVLLSGLKRAPRVRVDGKETPLGAPHEWLPTEGRLILRLTGQPVVEVRRRDEG